MEIYGYPEKKINEYGLLKMKEITFSVSPSILRDISKFFEETAALMEAGNFETCSHRHIQNIITDWDRRFPDSDIIIIPPEET